MAIHLTAAMRVIATGMTSVIRYVFTLTSTLITKRAHLSLNEQLAGHCLSWL